MNISESDKKRFWKKIDKSGDCWVWTKPTNRDGYGKFDVGGKTFRAHRFSYELMYGPIPDRMLVCHHCDNPRCVRPSHLFLGTHMDNHRDSAEKGRRARGEKHGNSKLTENDVYEIRRLYSLGVKKVMLARMWGIDKSNAGLIVNRRHWRHI